MDHIKEAFNKVKQDMDLLKDSINEIKKEIFELQNNINTFKTNPTQTPYLSTIRQITPTHPAHPFPKNNSFKPLKDKIPYISIGNDGVPTDRQTDRQTDQHTENSIENALEILNSLDNYKKEIRLKFKRLTEQEMVVFSAIYQLEEEAGFSDYKVLSKKLNLTESSIRDYVGRLIKKGIPVEKRKINNKNIHLNISQNLKNIASLSTILQLINT
jgi:DNA-binding MarR family transcriptional regulator